MIKDGKYIYCIIASEYDHNFGTIGIDGRSGLVTTIGHNGLCMVVSDHSLSKFVVNPDNILAHQKVIEEVMKEFNSVLPVRFGTIATTPDEIRNLLDRRYNEFLEFLKFFENKVELNIRGAWKDIDVIFKEISEENSDFREIKKEINTLKDLNVKKQKLTEAGKIVEKALLKKKETETEIITKTLKRTVFEFKNNKTNGDAVFMNTAFLVNSGRIKEFDFIMNDLGEQYTNWIDFKYTGPLPVFNFIDLKIFPEEWET